MNKRPADAGLVFERGLWQHMRDERNYSIDIIKTIAIIGVITIHSCYEGYGYSIGSFNWLSSVFWGSLTRASVPLFLMCSGALLLDPEKDMTIKKLYTKNMLRIIIALFFWATAYKIFILAVFQEFSLHALIQIFKEILVFKHESHLYYLHIIIIVYTFLPITRVFIRNANKIEVQYFLAIWFLLGILYPLIRKFWPFTLLVGIPAQWMMNMTYASIGYGILGYYLNKNVKSNKIIYKLLFVAGFLGVFIGTWIGSVRSGTLYQLFLEGMTPFVSFMATGIFGLVRSKNFFSSAVTSEKFKNPEIEAAISEIAAAKEMKNYRKIFFTGLSKASFCIYLVHKFFIYIFNLNGFKVNILPAIVSIPILVTVNLLCCVVVYLVLSRIPVVKKYII